MNKRSYLLPHVCQKIGWWLLLISVALTLFLFYGVGDSSYIHIIKCASILLSTGSIILICLAKEHTEDEYISYLRARTLKWLIVYALVANAIKMNLSFFYTQYSTVEAHGYIMMWINNIFTNPLILSVIYIILFKFSIWYVNCKCNKDGQ